MSTATIDAGTVHEVLRRHLLVDGLHLVVDLERSRDRDERKGVARAVANLAIGRRLSERQRRQLDRGDQLAGFEQRVLLGLIAGFSAASIDARPGLAIGVGGRPST